MKFLPALAAMAGQLATTSITYASALQAGEEICVEGYIMDFFCIDRGTLFDNPAVATLAEPERHSGTIFVVVVWFSRLSPNLTVYFPVNLSPLSGRRRALPGVALRGIVPPVGRRDCYFY